MNATLGQLLSVQSRLAEEAACFLDQIRAAADATPWEFGGQPLLASSAFVEPVVFTWREPGGGREGNGEGQRSPNESVKGLSPDEVLMLQQYERERHAGKNEEKRWDQVVRPGGRLRIVVTGEPGSGKSCTSSHTVARLAEESAAALRAHERDVSEVTLPMAITATHLFGQPAKRSVAEAVLGALEAQPKLKGVLARFRSLHGWLRRQVTGPNAFVVVDALDELRETQGPRAERFGGRLAELGSSETSLVVTCRTLPWERLKQLDLVPWQDAHHTVELKPLDDRRQRDYAEAFFAFLGKSALAADLDDLLRRSLCLREHARTPLILTFACGLLADGKLAAEASIEALYNQVIVRLLEGGWRKSDALPKWTQNKVRRERVRLFLGPLTWQLFQRRPASNRFTLADWDEDWAKAAGLARAPGTDPDRLLEELVKVGLLVEGGTDERGDECWSFAHRTVLEFLAAVGLHKDAVGLQWLLKEQKPIEKNPFWFKPEWLPTLTFLAAIMGDATPLIEAVQIPPLIDGQPAPQDDFFRQMFGLACRFAGAGLATPETQVERLAKEWFRGWEAALRGPLDCLREIWEGYGRNLAGRVEFSRHAVGLLLARLEHEKEPQIRQSIVHALGPLGDRSAVAPLLARLDREENLDVHQCMADALATLGGRAAVAPLLKRFERDRCPHLHSHIVHALGKLENRPAVAQSLARLERKVNYDVREEGTYGLRSIATALGKYGDGSAVARLLARLEYESNLRVCQRIVDALGALGDRPAVAPLLARLDLEGDREECTCIIEALVVLGDRSAVAPLLVRLEREEDGHVRWSITNALGELGDRSAVAPLLARLEREEDHTVRRSIVYALGRLGDRSAVAPLLARLGREENSYVCGNILDALGALGDCSAVAPLLARLEREEDSSVRSGIVGVLGALGDCSAVAPLLARLEREKDSHLRSGTAYALGTLGDCSAVTALRARLERELVSSVRSTIANALWKISNRQKCFVPPIRKQSL